MLTSVQSTHKTTDPVGCRRATVRRIHRHAQICHMTVLNRTAGRASECACQSDYIAGNVLCCTVNCDVVQIQVADLATCRTKQAKYIGFQRSVFCSDGNVENGMSFAVKISGKQMIVCASK